MGWPILLPSPSQRKFLIGPILFLDGVTVRQVYVYPSASCSSSPGDPKYRETMKLRLRSIDARGAAGAGAGAGAETHRVQLPDAATLSDVKAFLATKLSAAQPVPAESVRLTLNRSEELLSPEPSATLAALGVASGDLLYFTLSPLTALSAPPHPLPSNPSPDALSIARAVASSISPVVSDSSSSMPQALSVKTTLPAASESHPPDVVMTDVITATKSTRPSFVVRVLKRAIDNAAGACGTDTHHLVVALHEALLDAGFLSANLAGSLLQLPLDWASDSFNPLTMKYTLPEFVEMLPAAEGRMVAVLNYSLMGNYMMVYGHVPGAPSEVHRLCFELPELSPLMYLHSDEVSATEDSKIHKLWRVLKDEMCLPLMILLCRLNNLCLPPCLMALPGDVKSKVLEFVPGVDLARVQCTCKELRGLSADDNIWKKKCEIEFKAIGEGSQVSRTWKERFGAAWIVKVSYINKKRPKRLISPRFSNFGWGINPYDPLGFPMAGGDSDRLPFFGHHTSLGRSFGNQRRNISPSCNFDGRRHNFLG
ncbi:hypothetical protein GUJ93_ZPchr0006g41019 [Zizania palustris]|uniref:F-box domain-containing protein n=1 Tax=Zizania palustris TaxID=103762 RepID=A0A8J5VNU4_ZIZPA|nr:hypothetical protein GUJ93_ZPchr0006g41019 [Zizania palustris]